MHYADRCLLCHKDIAVLGQFCTECVTYPLQVQLHYFILVLMSLCARFVQNQPLLKCNLLRD